MQAGGAELALDLEAVKEVIRTPVALLAVRGVPPFVVGVINFRGVAIPVIDLKSRFPAGLASPGTGKTAPSREGSARRLVICAVSTKVVAFGVDAAEEIVRVAPETVGPPEHAGWRPVVAGMVPWRDRRLAWLDAGALLSPEELARLDSFRMRREDLEVS